MKKPSGVVTGDLVWAIHDGDGVEGLVRQPFTGDPSDIPAMVDFFEEFMDVVCVPGAVLQFIGLEPKEPLGGTCPVLH